MKPKQKAQVEYLKDRDVGLRMLRVATRLGNLATMKEISDRLIQLKRWRDDGVFLKETEKKEETAKMFRDEYQRMVREGLPVANHIRLVHLKDMAA